ncbi:MAG: DUF262 domain-containing protein [Pseudomonadota bacterium]
MRTDLDVLEDAEFWENDVNEQPPTDIFAFNELRSCADLFRMHEQKILDIQPEFQRDFVWKGPDQTRFIDSLIKQLPIPSLCFSYDAKQQKWLVIDGLQRISTIIRFLSGADWKLSKLDDIEPRIAGISAAAIKNNTELFEFYTRVENSTIPITVLRCDYSNNRHLSYLFTVFHRLNSTGLKLNNQEIRNCIFSGMFNRLLRELDEDSNWRKLNKMKKGESYRMQKQELILRFFAFQEELEHYTGSLASFLNSFMEKNRFVSEVTLASYRKKFQEMSKLLHEGLQSLGHKGKISITLQDSLCYGIGKNIKIIGNLTVQQIAAKISTVIGDPLFSEASLAEGLAKKHRLIDRMKRAEHLMR